MHTHPSAVASTVTVDRDTLLELLAHIVACEELLAALNRNVSPKAGERLAYLVARVFEDHWLSERHVDDDTYNAAFAEIRAPAYDLAAGMLDDLLREERLSLAAFFSGDGQCLAAWPAIRERLRERSEDLRRFADEERALRDSA